MESILLLTRAAWLLCPDAAPLCRYVQYILCLKRGPASNAQCQLGCVAGGMWAKLVAPFASSSSHTVLLGRRHSALLTPIGRCHGALYSLWPFCAPLWLPVALAVALAGSPAGSPTGLQLQMCLGAAHWLAAPAHRLFGPPLAMPPNHAHPPTTHKLSMLLQPRALCSLLYSPPIHGEPLLATNQPTNRPTGWLAVQCSQYTVQSSAAPTPLGTQKSVPARRPAGLQQTVSSFNPGRCPSPLPFSNSPSPP
ncbi:hypothetical protein TASIC1_0004016200 [Trichoderma asperellum]|uniref:Uncharacterized protein n=1 Tax=Trichoderma asperellum TaxID=101201 RepID=A0A6V8QU33_TRIAP|nr:hypothetical protein TASIC1_0004016200 [Trichoderma asperellum]